MAWGGARPGAGRKPTPGAKKANPRKTPARAEPKLKPSTAVTVPAEPKSLQAIDPNAWAMMLPEIEEISRKYSVKQARTSQNNPFKLPSLPERSLPAKPLTMAMDSNLTSNLNFAGEQWLSGGTFAALPGEGLEFLGFTYLAELAQRPEYRVMSETIADDATRKWIDFDVVGDEKKQKEDRAKDPQGYDERMADPDERKKRVDQTGKTDKVKALKDDQLRMEVKDRFYEQWRNDGFFGRSHLFLDIRAPGTDEISPDELKQSIGDSRDKTSETKCQKGFFQGMKTIEPVWTYPLMYNAINPLRKDWYNPQTWFVMGQEIDGTRCQTFIGHPVPDMLKPAYVFSGISLTQMAKPYVDIWLQTRQSVAQLIHSFSVMVLMTDLSTLMQPNNLGNLLARVAMFNMFRDNQGAFVVNKNTEDFKNVSASLGGLHELQAQAQEHMACLPAGTLVETDRGQVPIESVTLEDQVLTRSGFHPIKWVGVTGQSDTLFQIEAGGSMIAATEGHPIWAESHQEFVDAQNVSRSHRLLKSTSAANMGHRLSGAADGGGTPRKAIIGIKKLAACFIVSCGKRIEARSRLDGQTLGFAPARACSVAVSRASKIKVPLQPVYNIEVNGPHEFFANGLLVHNSVHRIPLVKFTGIQPAGLNASSEGEIKTYDDTIMASQSRFGDPNLRRIINFQQLSLFGEIDPSITHRWEPLREMTDAERGQKQKDEADRDDKYVAMGALSPEQVFHRIINDKDLPYTELSSDDVPDLLSEEEEGLEPEGGKPQPQVDGGKDKPDGSEEA